MTTERKTALYERHTARGAHMVAFKNTLLPVRFKSELEEHVAVRNAVGIFDVSHMGEFIFEGTRAREFLQHLLTNNIDKLATGSAHYSLMLNDNAGIIDDLIVYRLHEDRYLLCVNAGNIERDWQHVTEQAGNFDGCTIKNASADFSQLALQGPNSVELLARVSTEPLPSKFKIKTLRLGSVEAIVARTGYSGSDGFEIFVSNAKVVELFDLLMMHGNKFGLVPCGLAARDSLRLEAGLLLHGQDMDETITPSEAGLLFAVDLQKPSFIGKQQLLAKEPAQKLLGFKLLDKGLARHDFNVLDENSAIIGRVTSATYLSHKKIAIGFALVRAHDAVQGKRVIIDIRGRATLAELCSTRFLAR